MISVILSAEVYKLLQEYIFASDSSETGGFLFGRVNPSWVYIGGISGPGPAAFHGKYTIKFDREYIIKITQEMIEQDYFVIGTWHTHPIGSVCSPSGTDFETMRSFLKYGGGNEFIFCIASKRKEREKANVIFYSIGENEEVKEITIEVEDRDV